jgi:hypothetical protein
MNYTKEGSKPRSARQPALYVSAAQIAAVVAA